MWLQAGRTSLGHHFVALKAGGQKVGTLGTGTAPQPGGLCTAAGAFAFLGASSAAPCSALQRGLCMDQPPALQQFTVHGEQHPPGAVFFWGGGGAGALRVWYPKTPTC